MMKAFVGAIIDRPRAVSDRPYEEVLGEKCNFPLTVSIPSAIMIR